MNIKELSDSKAPLDIELSTNQGKKRLAVIIVISAIIVITVVAFFAFGGDSSKISDERVAELYKEYVEPVTSNTKLTLNEPDPQFPNEFFYEYYSPTDGLGYTVAHNTEKKTIQMQAIQPFTLDEDYKPITDHFWNLIYRYDYGKDDKPQYTAWLQADYKPDDNEQKADDLKSSLQVVLDADFNIVRSNGKIYKEGEDVNVDIKAFTNSEALETYEKYKADLLNLRQKLYDMFGEKHFRR